MPWSPPQSRNCGQSTGHRGYPPLSGHCACWPQGVPSSTGCRPQNRRGRALTQDGYVGQHRRDRAQVRTSHTEVDGGAPAKLVCLRALQENVDTRRGLTAIAMTSPQARWTAASNADPARMVISPAWKNPKKQVSKAAQSITGS